MSSGRADAGPGKQEGERGRARLTAALESRLKTVFVPSISHIQNRARPLTSQYSGIMPTIRPILSKHRRPENTIQYTGILLSITFFSASEPCIILMELRA